MTVVIDSSVAGSIETCLTQESYAGAAVQPRDAADLLPFSAGPLIERERPVW